LEKIIKETINVLITGCGAPGISGTIFSLKQKNDYIDIRTVGTDTNPEAVGQYFCDDFFVIPSFKDTTNYLESLLDICKKKSIHIIVPQNTLELGILSDNKALFENNNVQILISNKESIEKSNNKYELLKVAEKIGIPCVKFYEVSNIIDLEKKLKSFGWPKKRVVIKPPLSNGSRGVRIIDESINLKEKFFNEKPGSLFINFEMIKLTLGEFFDKLLIMEYLDGREYTVDVMKVEDKSLIIPRSRGAIKSGITFFGMVEKHKLIEEYSLRLAEALGLKFCFGFQFIMKDDTPFLIECNPRVQGSMVISTMANANIILNSILLKLNKGSIPMDLRYGTTFTRYWGGIAKNNDTTMKL
tara:strand:- start:4219 stop:5289 length:1071 start_codon:yes stop_codon:yes gene_type:complete